MEQLLEVFNSSKCLDNWMGWPDVIVLIYWHTISVMVICWHGF